MGQFRRRCLVFFCPQGDIAPPVQLHSVLPHDQLPQPQGHAEIRLRVCHPLPCHHPHLVHDYWERSRKLWHCWVRMKCNNSRYRKYAIGQEMALVMQTTHAQRWQYPDRVDKRLISSIENVHRYTLQKSLSLSITQTCFKRYHHDLLRHLVAFSKFEWF